MMTLQQQAEQIKKAITRQREMMKLRREGATLQEIGTRYDLTRERVRQILKAAEQDREGA